MADPRGFISKQRQLAERRPVDERLTDWKEVYPGTPGRALLPIITDQATALRSVTAGQNDITYGLSDRYKPSIESAKELTRKATLYCETILKNSEEVLGRSMADIKNTRMNLRSAARPKNNVPK